MKRRQRDTCIPSSPQVGKWAEQGLCVNLVQDNGPLLFTWQQTEKILFSFATTTTTTTYWKTQHRKECEVQINRQKKKAQNLGSKNTEILKTEGNILSLQGFTADQTPITAVIFLTGPSEWPPTIFYASAHSSWVSIITATVCLLLL